ncbi:UDP-N-acetylglucosamine diphosphorylase/glucosamine-1-phosphate N-acetyltransferase [candidate division TM6 bacterium RIFCSPHIGHO2_12_FULL_36_22]|nr:MAG: UDP-N-acetylglucosamine diphosphorylase/glucosamine-1-phosphate N-acetyltransferase [candidate division TM6 bacterium RIFCSPHIGHO2_12_FULL_36_22]
MLSNVEAIVLAAGKSTRFNTGKTKLIEKICGQEMILYPATLLNSLNIPMTFVVGYQKEVVVSLLKERFNDNFKTVDQGEQRGTGHAIMCTQSTWTQDHILIMNGDTPLIKPHQLRALYDKHISTDAAMTFMTAYNIDPTINNYGRVIEDDKGISIIEASEFEQFADKLDKDVACINAGIYLLKRSFLDKYITQLPKNPTTGEFYFTEIVKLGSDAGLTISTINIPFDTVRGINTLRELWSAEQIKKSELIGTWMEKGVRFGSAQSVHIDLDVEIGQGSSIGTGVQLFKGTKIGTNCIIESFSMISNTHLEDYVHIYSHSNIKDSTIKHHSCIGPFAHVRGNTKLAEHVRVGNFVEINRSEVGAYTRIRHMCYIGDATIGKYVSLGAGSITCNFDGIEKHKTEIQDNAFIGSNTAFVAPVIVGKNAYTAAGSVITQNVPDKALAIARSRQFNKEDYTMVKQQKKNISQQLEAAYIAATKTVPDSFNENP